MSETALGESDSSYHCVLFYAFCSRPYPRRSVSSSLVETSKPMLPGIGVKHSLCLLATEPSRIRSNTGSPSLKPRYIGSDVSGEQTSQATLHETHIN